MIPKCRRLICPAGTLMLAVFSIISHIFYLQCL
jgi:hypothetical protein